MRIPVGEFLPDIAELDTNVSAVARNVLPGPNSYRPVRQAVAYSSPMEAGAVARGLILVQDPGGLFKAFAGSTDKLWALTSTTWAQAGSGYTATVDERWSFAQWGTQVLACNLNDPLQVYDLVGGGSFGPVDGAPPRARFVDVISDFVVLAGLADDPQALQWSGIDDETSWEPGTDLSDIQSFPDGGRVMNFSGAAGLVIQERKIRQMIRSPGSPVGAFEFQEIEAAKGTIAPFSVVKYGSAIAWLAEDGFWFGDQPIGKNKVDNYFLSRVTQDRLYSVIGTFDPTGPRFLWAYKTGASDGYDAVLVYDWSLQRWSELDGSVFEDIGGLYDLSSLATAGLSIDDLDTLYGSLDAIPYSLDSRAWLGGRPVLAAVGADGVLAFLEGDTALATIETGERELITGRRALVQGTRPLVDAEGVLVQAGTRDRLASARVWGATSTMQASGRVPMRAGGRYQRFRMLLPVGSNWTNAQGIEVEAVPMGIR